MTTQPHMEFRINNRLYGLSVNQHTQLATMQTGWEVEYAPLSFSSVSRRTVWAPDREEAIAAAVVAIVQREERTA